jgi:4-hydroxyphenylpyruvate dioxygenase-like putative hemolysin
MPDIRRQTLEVFTVSPVRGMSMILQNSIRRGIKHVALNCPNCVEDLFWAIKPKRGVSGIETSETANENIKQMLECKGEFLERLDFLVTFLAMKKVTKKHLVQRDQ